MKDNVDKVDVLENIIKITVLCEFINELRKDKEAITFLSKKFKRNSNNIIQEVKIGEFLLYELNQIYTKLNSLEEYTKDTYIPRILYLKVKNVFKSALNTLLLRR